MSKVKPKKTRSPERTRKKLLNAGIKLFSRYGYEGTSVDDLVNTAKCNKRMLYHYYKSKEGLYIEVLRAVFSKLESCEIDATETADNFDQAIRNILERYFEFLADNPNFVRLLMWENLNQGQFLEKHPDLLNKAPLMDRLQEILTDAKASKLITGKVDTRHITVMLIGACFIQFSNRYTLRHTMGLDLTEPKVLKDALALNQEVLTQGLIAHFKVKGLD